MICSKYVRVLFLIAISMLATVAMQPQDARSQERTTVHLRWGERAGVSRYRLQLANDSLFRDIVFDRIVNGNEATVDDLPPGRYFWRIAPLTSSLGEFSSAGVIEVTANREPLRPVDQNKTPHNPFPPVVAGGGWRAAVGDIAQPVLAHLRSPEQFDVVGTNSDGVTYALEAANGIPLWSVRMRNVASRTLQANAPLIIPSRTRLDNIVVFAGTQVIKIEGATGRELWRASLPFAVSSGAVIGDHGGYRLWFLDSSLQRLIMVSEADGRLSAPVALPSRVIGAPVSLGDQTGFMLAYDTGRIEIRDGSGALIRSADGGSAATTSPIFVGSTTGNLVLVGMRDGLTAVNANELRALGRVAIKDDAPRGVLMSHDLDGDGNTEVIMTTARGHVVVVNARDGRVVWNVAVDVDGGRYAFADINGDKVLDIIFAGNRDLAVALSGRDGSVIWKDGSPSSSITNHANATARSIVAVPFGQGILVIGSEPNGSSLRAIAFPKAEIRLNPQ